jgi:tetratricopeptide (TPR) repeat protein
MLTSFKTFRVFISSTFADMKEERSILQKEVFPKLQKYCESKGARFQAVDLRWGVTETSQLEQKTIDICLGEVKRCQKISPKPNFIILLGNRYGWQPVPSKIPHFEMEEIMRNLSSDEKDLLDKWYKLDENAIPAEFILQPREGENIEYTIWENTEKRLREIFRKTVSKLDFSNDQKNKYYCSATHLEILNGALNPPKDVDNPEKHVFAYVRNIEGLPYDKTAKDFIDIHNDRQYPYSRDRLTELKTELREKLQDNCHNYWANWDGETSNISDPDGFANRIFNDLLSIIDKQINESVNPDTLEQEVKFHEDFKNKITEHFTGREEALARINDYITNTDNIPCLLYGVPGSGKSSVIAKAIKNAEKLNHDAAIVYRFAGTTSSASGIVSLLKSICRQIAQAYAIDLKDIVKEFASASIGLKAKADDWIIQYTEEQSDTLAEYNLVGLTKLFARCLSFSSDDKPLWLFIDALDQLNLQDRRGDLYWLPKVLPPNTKLIVSALPEFADVLTYCRCESLDLLPESDANKILHKWFQAISRQVTKGQLEEIISCFNINGLPIYLKLAFERARNWKSYTGDFSLSNSVDGIINNLMDELEKEHSKDFVQNVVSYLLNARYLGLTENEILEILVFDKEYWNKSFLTQTHPLHRNELKNASKIPIVVWSRLYFDLEPYLAERDANGYPVISFFHRQFISTLEERYLSNPDIQVVYHKKLANYFENNSIENRKVLEMPWQLMQSKQWERLSDTICDKQFFNTLYGLQKPDLHIYWTKIEKDSSIKLSLLEHQRIISTLDYEIKEDVAYSLNQSSFLHERKLYMIAIKYLEDLAIFQQEVLPVSHEDDLPNTLNQLYSNYIASKNWNAAIQTSSEILKTKHSLPIILKHSTSYYVEELDDLNVYKKKLLKAFLSSGALFMKTVQKSSSEKELAYTAGSIAEFFLMQKQPEQAMKWYEYQNRINIKNKHQLKNIFWLFFLFSLTLVFKIYVRIKKSDQNIFSSIGLIKQHPMFRGAAIDEFSRLFAIGVVNMHKTKYSKAIKYLKRAQKIAQEYELSKENLDCVKLLAKSNFETGNFKKSIEYFEEARREYESASDIIELANVCNGMAKAYEQLNDFHNAEKCLVTNTKIWEQLGDDERLKHNLDLLYQVSSKNQQKDRAEIYKAQRDAIDIAPLSNEDLQPQKRPIFDTEMSLHQLYYDRAETYWESERYDEAKNILSDLKHKIKTYRPHENTLSGIESLLRPWVKKPGYLVGFVLAILQISLFWSLRWLNSLVGFLQNERAVEVILFAIIVLVYAVSAFIIEKKNLKKLSVVLVFSLTTSSVLGWLVYMDDDFPFNWLLGVVFIFGLHFFISYIIISVFKFSIIRIKRLLAKRAQRIRKRELGLDEMHPFVLRSLMKCNRLEADIHYSLKEYDKAYEVYKELETMALKTDDTYFLITAIREQLACLYVRNELSEHAEVLAEKLENLLPDSENEFLYGVTKLASVLHTSYVVLKYYYSDKGIKQKAQHYEKQMQKMEAYKNS